MNPKPAKKHQIAACSATKDIDPALIAVCPGGMKTRMAADDALAKRTSDTAIVFVVPTVGIKRGVRETFRGNGMHLMDCCRKGELYPSQYAGVIVTYQQLPSLVDTFEIWKQNSYRMHFVFDEIHHAGENNTWGAAVKRCAFIADRFLALTGTPFRSDGSGIAGVTYEDGVCSPDYTYPYSRAIKDHICRPVDVRHDDGAVVVSDGRTIQISECSEDDEPLVVNTIFRKGSQFAANMFRKANAVLDDYRKEQPDAAGLVICRPGRNGEDDLKHVHELAEDFRIATGESVEVVASCDDKAEDKIDSFRTSTAKWLFAVRMISEGVDIPRLRVVMFATNPTTELLVRQMVGRVVRQNQEIDETEWATVLIAKLPRLHNRMKEIENEVVAAIKEREEPHPQRDEQTDDVEFDRSEMPYGLFCTHEDGGMTSRGEVFSPDRVSQADQLRQTLGVHCSVSDVCRILEHAGAPCVPVEEEDTRPEQEKRKELSDRIWKLANIVAAKTETDRGHVFTKAHDTVGAMNARDLAERHPITSMHRVIEFLENWLRGIKDAS